MDSNLRSGFKGTQKRLSSEALTLKKAWLLCVAIVGVENIKPQLEADELELPDYSKLTRKELYQQVRDLEENFMNLLGHIVYFRSKKNVSLSAARQLEAYFDSWQAADGGVYTISTVYEFEKKVGRLRSREHVETPPYGEMLLQGANGLAIRHPEYMLVRDLGLFYDLYLDAERLHNTADQRGGAKWGKSASENRQSLARAVVITCFNLLEAFIYGIARAHLMTRTITNNKTCEELKDTRKPLKKRLVNFTRIVAGYTSLDINKPPMSVLFDSIVNSRDAFIHCEPGPQQSERGYYKEMMFHDVPRSLVDDAINYTFEIIRTVWCDVHGTGGPRWLPDFEDGRFGKHNLHLNPDKFS